MATDHLEGSEFSWRRVLPWTELFKGFQVALDLNKLLLAAGGILVMHLGWWLLSVGFTAPLVKHPPEFGGGPDKNWARFQHERAEWNLMHEAAGLTPDDQRQPWEVADLAETQQEYELFQGAHTGAQYRALVERLRSDPDLRKEKGVTLEQVDQYARRAPDYDKLGQDKPRGELSTWPWFEDRGPNPYLLVTGQAGIPWEAGRFWEWFIEDQFPVMIEPLIKFFQPIWYLFQPKADFMARVYFLCVTLWTLITWSFFGGAITRIAVVQVARGERVGLVEALRYTFRHFLSYLTAPLFPLAGILVILLLMFAFGLFHMIPVFGDIVVSGLFWPVVVVLGLLMAITLVGLVSWPLMSATISAEGHDSWEAVSRAYSYLFQRPWQYLGYSLIAIVYGAVLVFFVGLMASLTVYLAEWGVARIQPQSRDPAYLFVYAPTSFGWRSLLLQDAKTANANVVHMGEINQEAYQQYLNSQDWHWWNTVGAVMMAFWMGLLFLMVIGFGYSYFWTASSIIYLLMRRSIDAAELDEVYLEEEEQESPFGPSLAPGSAEAPKPGQVPLTMAAPPPGGPPAAPSALGGVPPGPETREAEQPAPTPPPPSPAPPVAPGANAPGPPAPETSGPSGQPAAPGSPTNEGASEEAGEEKP
jgi:hypothetical protein